MKTKYYFIMWLSSDTGEIDLVQDGIYTTAAAAEAELGWWIGENSEDGDNYVIVEKEVSDQEYKKIQEHHKSCFGYEVT